RPESSTLSLHDALPISHGCTLPQSSGAAAHVDGNTHRGKAFAWTQVTCESDRSPQGRDAHRASTCAARFTRARPAQARVRPRLTDRKSTRLNSSHVKIS